MSYTKYDNLIARGASVPKRDTFPANAEEYYGVNVAENDALDWEGGEMFFYTTDSRLYLNSATSGRTATWRRLADALDTSTTSSTTTTTSSTTSSSTSTSTSTSTTTTA